MLFARNRYAHPSHLRWHLGQNFSVEAAKLNISFFTDWLLETAQTHQMDAIIVAGDVFDTARRPVTPARYTTVLLSIANWLSSGGTGRKP